jgi:hypothetical protein
MTDKLTEAHDSTPATGAVGSLFERGVRRVLAEGTHAERLARRDMQLRLYAMKWPRDSSGNVLGTSETRRIDAWCYMQGITRERGRQIVKKPSPWLRATVVAWHDETANLDAAVRSCWYANKAPNVRANLPGTQ